MSSSWRAASAAWAGFSRRPVERPSITATSSPRSRGASARLEPMKPAPPVTRVRIAAEDSSRRPPRRLLRSPRMRGLFVTFEGIDRSGKTTQAERLSQALGEDAIAVREPGGTDVGERIRDILKDQTVELSPQGEALLFAAARAELVSGVIRPALAEGRVVVSDRFLDSSLAYQGHARGLGVEEVERINRFATGGVMPDLTILLWIDPAAAAARSGEADRFEDEGERLQREVRAAYEELADADPERWHRVDADRPPDEVHVQVLAAVQAMRAVRA